MIYESPLPETTVEEYDFQLKSGNHVQATINPKFDTITFGEDEVTIWFGPKKSRFGSVTPAEDLHILHSSIELWSHHLRVFTDPNPEQEPEALALDHPLASKFVN